MEHTFNAEQILKSMVPNIEEMQKAEFKAVMAANGIDANGFAFGAVVAAANGVVSLGVGALFGVNASPVNSAIGLAVTTVAGGVATKMMDNPIMAAKVAGFAGLLGTQAVAHGAEYLRTERVNTAPEQFI